MFKSVGQVVGLRYVSALLALIILKRSRPSYISLVFDRDTGKPKGYGFCEFAGQFYPKYAMYARAVTNLPCR